MSSETKYWCDRCGIEVLGLEYVEIKSENAEDDRPKRRFLELCSVCRCDLFAAIDETMQRAGVA